MYSTPGIWQIQFDLAAFYARYGERATYESIPFCYVAAGLHPDHDTIAHFRKAFLDHLSAGLRHRQHPVRGVVGGQRRERTRYAANRPGLRHHPPARVVPVRPVR